MTITLHQALSAWYESCYAKFLHAYTRASQSAQIVRADDPGMATAEYAIVLVAATSFAAVLVAILKSDIIKDILTKLITDALSIMAK